MQRSFLRMMALIAVGVVALGGTAAVGQSSSGTITGTVTDATGAVIPGASVEISNPVSGYTRDAVADSSGQFRFVNIPFNPYRVTVKFAGFQNYSKLVQVSSAILVTVPVALQIATSDQSISVDATEDLVESDPTAPTRRTR